VSGAAELDVRPLTTERFADLAQLFNEGGDPKWCWCQYWRKPGSSWTSTTPAQNRQDLLALVGREAGPAPGLVALQGGAAVGWVGLGPRAEFPRLARSRTIPQLPGDGVWVVNCFVVARTARRSGVASALLGAAVAYAREHGARILEGYPVQTGGSRMASASAYTGTAGMFERAGFSIASETTSKASGGLPRIVARLDL
jgi:GNAT superfamily N-acetyltransferase